MTLQQTLHADSKETKELFDKLEATSDGAVKTRENLFGELSRDLRLHAEIEERDLFPALRKDGKTSHLVTDAAKRNRELRAKIDELEALPKDDPSFRERIVELRKLFQQQLRGERQELVPALKKDQSEAVENKVETRRAQAEQEREAEEEERREEARREAEHRKAAAARNRAAEQVAEATKRTARDLAKTVSERTQDGADTVLGKSQKAAERTANAARRVREAAGEAVTGYRETVRESREDVKAIGGAVRNFAKVGSEMRSLMVNSVKQSARNRLDMARHVIREPLKFGELQREYAATASRNRIETVTELMQLVRSASSAARLPLEERLRAVH